MRIAITGATGFAGTHLTRRLESEGPLPYDLVPTRRFTIDQIRDGVLSHKKAQKAQNENRLKGEEKRVSESEKIILCLLCLFVALLWLS
jgi:nucleoside-diphosphate-sugar epimerase